MIKLHKKNMIFLGKNHGYKHKYMTWYAKNKNKSSLLLVKIVMKKKKNFFFFFSRVFFSFPSLRMSLNLGTVFPFSTFPLSGFFLGTLPGNISRHIFLKHRTLLIILKASTFFLQKKTPQLKILQYVYKCDRTKQISHFFKVFKIVKSHLWF